MSEAAVTTPAVQTPPAGAAPTTPSPAAAPPAQGAPPPQAGAPQQAPSTPKPPETPQAPAEPAAPAEIAIKLPEGVQADKATLDKYVETAKKHGLSQQQAQGVVDFWMAQRVEGEKAFKAAFDAARQKNQNALRSDPEFGGAKYEHTIAAFDEAVLFFGGDEAAKVLKAYGADAEPAVVKMLARAKAAISEDKSIRAHGARPNPEHEERKARYPKSPELWGSP